ncbi:MAG: MotA/TolQ/ExbB proton channel family protein [Deltaproteobacteria bacterium]|nr:MotA/TolQ/ExbB proton channel family protein [Deltaproteobacteria bacterium]
MGFSGTLQDFFLGIGVDWVLYLLVGLSVLSVAVIIERWVFFARRRVTPDAVHALARGQVAPGFRDAMERRVAARVAALAAEGASRDDMENGVEQELRKRRGRYETGLTFLATLGNNAPFVGLLGTVLGIMAAFWQLSTITDTQQKNEALMTSISEALIATAMGLIVAIPAVAFYNVFRKRVNAAVEQSREIATHRVRALRGGDDGGRAAG